MPHLTLIAALCLLTLTATAAEAWNHSDAESTPGLPGNEIQYLGPSPRGGVWIGTLTGATYWQDNTFHPLLDNQEKPLNLRVWTVYEHPGNHTFIGHGKGILHIRPDGSHQSALDNYTVAPIIPVRENLLWAIARRTHQDNNNLYQFNGKDWTPHPDTERMNIVDLMLSSKGNVWLILEGNGVIEVDPEAGFETAVHHQQGMNITTIMEDSRQRVWVGFWDRGVAIYDGTAWEQTLKTKKGNAIISILQDTHNNMWVATSANGLYHRPFNKQQWTNMLAEEGAINLLASSSDGRVWLSSQMVGGLRYWDGQDWHLSLDSPLPIRAFFDTPKAYWAGGILDGIHRAKK